MSQQKKLLIGAFLIIIVAVAAIAGVYYKSSKEVDVLPGADAKTVTLQCSNGYSGTATYYDADPNGILQRAQVVATKDGLTSQHLMKQAVSASGARFETKDMSVSLWEHQGEFTLRQGETILAVCQDASKMTFIIDGNPVTLTNGLSEEEIAPGSVSKNIVKYFGNEAKGDINGDGKEDRVFFITKESGGSGVFYYVAGMLTTDVLPKGTQATLVGDRIAPQTISIENGIVLVNYADRKPSEPFTAQPSVGKTLRLKLDPKELDFGEVVANFEGEADTATMNLSMKDWKWQKTLYNDGKEILPVAKDKFIAKFTKDGHVSFQTDCNTMNASFSVANGSIIFNQMMSTLMFCEGSQEQTFSGMLQEVDKYIFTSRGELILLLKKDSGSMIFK